MRRDQLLSGAVPGGAIVSLLGVAFLVPVPWSIPVAAALVGAELLLYRRLQPFDADQE